MGPLDMAPAPTADVDKVCLRNCQICYPKAQNVSTRPMPGRVLCLGSSSILERKRFRAHFLEFAVFWRPIQHPRRLVRAQIRRKAQHRRTSSIIEMAFGAMRSSKEAKSTPPPPKFLGCAVFAVACSPDLPVKRISRRVCQKMRACALFLPGMPDTVKTRASPGIR